MRSSPSLFACLLAISWSIAAQAGDAAPNVAGMPRRLKSISCGYPPGGNVFNRSNYYGRINGTVEGKCGRDLSSDRTRLCMQNELSEAADIGGVVFEANPIGNSGSMNMEIWTFDAYGPRGNDKRLFQSARVGSVVAGSDPSAPTIRFDREGVAHDEYAAFLERVYHVDPYVNERGYQVDGGDFVSRLVVPIRRRFASDRLAVFMNCRVQWEETH